MLNNLKLKVKNYNLSKHSKKTNQSLRTKHDLPADKEWFNSIYAYNKNTLPLLPEAHKLTLKSLKNYFNLYNYELEKKARIPRIKKSFRKLSTNRILVSNAELKHSSDKIIITVYLYNRQRSYYINKLIRVGGSIINLNEEDYFIRNPIFSNLLLKKIKEKCSKIMLKVYKQKRSLFSFIENNIFKNYQNKYIKKLLIKCLQKETLLMHQRQIISFNKSLFEKTSLLPIIKLIKNVYKKKVEFNLVDIKYLYLNSYIFSETLVAKIIKRKHKLKNILNASFQSFFLPPLDKLSNRYSTHNTIIRNSKVNFRVKSRLKKKILDNFFKIRGLSSSNVHEEYITNKVLNSVKHKYTIGLRIEAAGRLTRGSGAQKSVYTSNQKGNLKNIDSSYKGYSSVLLRGYAKCNVQYTKLQSKLPRGSFGLKGWVGAY